jgi:hypothetical protein
MSEAAGSPGTGVAGGEKIVVLLLPELLGVAVDEKQLGKTLRGGPKNVRALLCLPDQDGQALAATLERLGVETEILLGPAVATPTTHAFVLRAPPGTSPLQQTEFALALADVVLFAPGREPNSWFRNAKVLGKRTIAIGEPMRANQPLDPANHNLDPETPARRRAWGRRMCGRLEQFLLELLAFSWRGWNKDGVAYSWRRLCKCIVPDWRPGFYFAPSAWLQLAPDRSALQSSGIIACFDGLDRSALYGSYVHRDLVWLEHIGAGFAVFAAVAGYIALWGGLFEHLGWHTEWVWGGLELVTLIGVATMVWFVRRTQLQDRWTACRLGAEQLRIALMSMPLLVLPSALATSDEPPPADEHGTQETQFGYSALAQVKRAVRDHGLPRLDPGLTIEQAAKWLHLIILDQIDYHRGNHGKLEHAENRLRGLTKIIFFAAMACVVAHFFWHASVLLLATAAGPAFAAALHGTGTRLGIVHRAALSSDVAKELAKIDADLIAVEKLPTGEEAWTQIRRLAFAAAEAMGRENSSWHGLVRRYRDDLP